MIPANKRAQPLERIGLQERELRIQRPGAPTARDLMNEAQLYGTPGSAGRRRAADALAAASAIVALLVALGMLALVLAHWGWQWFGPAPATVDRVAASGDDARRITEAHLFGTAPHRCPGAVAAASASGDLRLLGIIAQRDGTRLCVVPAGARPVAGRGGQDVGQWRAPRSGASRRRDADRRGRAARRCRCARTAPAATRRTRLAPASAATSAQIIGVFRAGGIRRADRAPQRRTTRAA